MALICGVVHMTCSFQLAAILKYYSDSQPPPPLQPLLIHNFIRHPSFLFLLLTPFPFPVPSAAFLTTKNLQVNAFVAPLRDISASL